MIPRSARFGPPFLYEPLLNGKMDAYNPNQTEGCMATGELNRQIVNVGFFKVEPAWRRLPAKDRERGKVQFCQVATEWGHSGRMTVLSYTTVGMRADNDFMLWRICYHLEEIQEMTTALLSTALGQYLT